MKIIAMGFIIHKNSYLRDTWNGLDFIVIVVGIVEEIKRYSDPYGDSKSSGMKSLRTLRVLRPLRSINAFPSMKRLIGSLLSSLPSLANAVVFMFFIFLLFGILGIQSFQGALYFRCRTDENPTTLPSGAKEWPVSEENGDRLCSKTGEGNYMCPKHEFCGAPTSKNMTLKDDGVYNSENVNFGIIHFDDIVYAMITIIQLITLEGWSGMMYNLQDASQPWMAILFCILLVIVGSWFLLNVILAVIMQAFEDVDAN